MDSKKSLISGTIWSGGGQLAVLLIGLITNVWLVRLLSPKEFGQVGIVMFFIVVCTVLTEGGLSGALIRKKEATKDDYSTVFVMNLVVSLFLYSLLYIFSYNVADYYDDPELTNLLKVSGLVLIVNAFQITRIARLMSDLRFKARIIYRLISITIASVLAIATGYLGWGVWSLVVLQLMTSSFLTALLVIFEKGGVGLKFSKSCFMELYSFGVNTTLASMINTGFENIYQLILGRYFTIAQVGFYYQAKKLQDVSAGMLNMVSQSVIFPILAKLQEDVHKFEITYKKVTQYFLVLLGLITCFIYLYAEQVITILYGDEWYDSIFYLQLLSLASFFLIQEKLNRIIFKIFNQTRQILVLEIVKKVFHTISIVLGITYMSLDILLIGFIIINAISYFINYYFSRKVINSFDMSELKTLLFVSLLCFVCIVSVQQVMGLFQTDSYTVLLTVPFLLLLYFSILWLGGIFDVVKESKSMVSIYRKR